MPAPSELRTRVSLDPNDAAQQMQALQKQAEQMRLAEFAGQEKLIRDLSNLTIEELNKQITAQDRLLAELNLRKEKAGDEDRQRMVQEFNERKKLHEDRLRQLDVESAKLQEQFTMKHAELGEARSGGGSTETDEAREIRILRIKDIEDEIAAIVEKSRKTYIDKTDEAYKMEQDRLDTLKRMLEHEKAKGGDEEGGGLSSILGGLRGLPDQINKVGSALSGALSPFMRLLGIGGVAFSLEQVVEKLYKANSELREMRANYADIAASMGDLVGGSGMFFSRSQTELMDLQDRLALSLGDSIDKKLVPQIAKSLSTGGFQSNALAALTENTIDLATGSGISPQEIASTFTRLYREFNVGVGQVTDVTNELIQDAHRLRMPFQDLAKWTMTLTEQTRVYGFGIEDSRRVVNRFAEELEKGVVTMGDLVKMQKSMSELGQSQATGIAAFLDRLDFSRMGGDAGRDRIRSVGGIEEQQALIQYMGQGQLPEKMRETLTAEQKELWGQFFNLVTGHVKPEYANFGNELSKALVDLGEKLSKDIKAGPAMQEMAFETFMKSFGIDISGPVEKSNTLLERVEQGLFNIKSSIDKQTEDKKVDENKALTPADITSKETLEVCKQGVTLMKDKASATSRVTEGISQWWRDTSESFMLGIGLAFGSDLDKVKAESKTRAGAAAYAGFREGGSGGNLDLVTGEWTDSEGKRKSLADASMGELEERVKAGIEKRPSSYLAAGGAIKKELLYLQSQGKLPDDLKEATKSQIEAFVDAWLKETEAYKNRTEALYGTSDPIGAGISQAQPSIFTDKLPPDYAGNGKPFMNLGVRSSKQESKDPVYPFAPITEKDLLPKPLLGLEGLTITQDYLKEAPYKDTLDALHMLQKQGGNLDVDSKTAGVQINIDGIVVNTGFANEDDLRKALTDNFTDTANKIIETIRNHPRGSR